MPYDVRKEKFLKINIFKSQPKIKWHSQKSGIKKVVCNENLTDKLNFFSFDAEFTIRVLFFPISGSFNYARRNKEYYNSKSYDVKYEYITGSEKIIL